MENLVVNIGVKKIMINGDPNNILEFNPSDVDFAGKFYSMIGEVENELEEFRKKAEILELDTSVDSHGIPNNFKERITTLRGACDFLKDKIDYLFGAGTSEKVFGKALNLDMFTEFLEGIVPFMSEERIKKIEPYLATGKKRKAMK